LGGISLALRFILGVAEAGLFPGVILYLTYWFPAAYRARIISAFMVAIPLSLAVGSPISTAILPMGGIAGFKGWQWLFLIEGAPTILLAVIVLLVLPDRPREGEVASVGQHPETPRDTRGERFFTPVVRQKSISS
jgi:ACS family tartrate transporter-like MFS transporter